MFSESFLGLGQEWWQYMHLKSGQHIHLIKLCSQVWAVREIVAVFCMIRMYLSDVTDVFDRLGLGNGGGVRSGQRLLQHHHHLGPLLPLQILCERLALEEMWKPLEYTKLPGEQQRQHSGLFNICYPPLPVSLF